MDCPHPAVSDTNCAYDVLTKFQALHEGQETAFDLTKKTLGKVGSACALLCQCVVA